MLATLLLTAMVSSSSGPAVFVPPPVYVEPAKVEMKAESRPAKTMPAATPAVTTKTVTYSTQAPYRDPVGSHRHRCPVDGYIWNHETNAGHNCPQCGREQLYHYTGPLPPTAKATVVKVTKPAPKVEAVEEFESPPQFISPLTFALPKSNCPDGNCPKAQPTRRGLFGWR